MIRAKETAGDFSPAEVAMGKRAATHMPYNQQPVDRFDDEIEHIVRDLERSWAR